MALNGQAGLALSYYLRGSGRECCHDRGKEVLAFHRLSGHPGAA